MEGVIGGRFMAHPRQGVMLHTVYRITPGRQPDINTGAEGNCYPFNILVE
jgi:hypothetical protein